MRVTQCSSTDLASVILPEGHSSPSIEVLNQTIKRTGDGWCKLQIRTMPSNDKFKILFSRQVSNNDGVHRTRWILSNVDPRLLNIHSPVQSSEHLDAH